MEHAVPSENFQRENGTTFSEVHFPVERIKKYVPFPTQLKFPESLKLVSGKRPQYTDVSTKIFSRKCKSVRDNADWRYG